MRAILIRIERRYSLIKQHKFRDNIMPMDAKHETIQPSSARKLSQNSTPTNQYFCLKSNVFSKSSSITIFTFVSRTRCQQYRNIPTHGILQGPCTALQHSQFLFNSFRHCPPFRLYRPFCIHSAHYTTGTPVQLWSNNRANKPLTNL